MMNNQVTELSLKEVFLQHLESKEFPCIAARSAVHAKNVSVLEVGHIACPKDDAEILRFLYEFVDQFRLSTEGFMSAAIIFSGPQDTCEEHFERFMWQRLQALHDLDAKQFSYDDRVSNNPADQHFSFSLKAESFFIIGMHPGSSRPARRFNTPVLVFNPHQQFQRLKANNQFEKIKQVVRMRDERTAGSVNPMMADFGTRSETFQYSGRQYDESWTCPLNIKND